MKKLSVSLMAVCAIALAVTTSAFTSKLENRNLQGHISTSPDQWKSLGDVQPDQSLCDETPSVVCYRVIQDNGTPVNLQFEGIYFGE